MGDRGDEAAMAGQAVYTRGMLGVYDWWVLGVSNRWIWKCPTPRLLAFYDRFLTRNHLDVGVGTGYFLDRCVMSRGEDREEVRLGLVDLNGNSLEATARRVSRYGPQCYRANVLEPLKLTGEPYASVGINYLLHCLPGSLAEKAVVFDHVNAWLAPGGVVFGSTLLQGAGVERSGAAKRLMAFYNGKGIFSNERDDVAGLEKALGDRYEQWGVEVAGCGAMFWAKGERRLESRGQPGDC